MKRRRWIIAVGLVMAAASSFSIWTVRRTDGQLRRELLKQAALVAQAVDMDFLSALTGTAADLNKPEFVYLENQLSRIKQVNKTYVYVYLMARSDEGDVYFLLDVQNASEDTPPSQPGEWYPEASEELIAAFDTQQPFVEGPLSDEWGTWVSALVPLVCPQTGKTLAILGIDVDAKDWAMKVVNRAALPAAMGLAMLTALMLGLAAFSHYHTLIRTEAQLRQSEERFRTLFKKSPDAQLIIEDNRIFDCNSAALRLMDIARREQLLNRTVVELSPTHQPDGMLSTEKAKQLIAKVLAEGSCQFEWIHRTPQGRDFIADILLTAIVRQGKTLLHCVLRDITERKRAECELEKSREQYMLAVNGGNDGIWDWDLRDGSLYLSTKWKQMIGYEDHELPNVFATFEERLHPDDKERVQAYLKRYLDGHIKHYQIDFRFRHRDGSYRWILARGEALRDEKGIPYRMAGSHTDITERKLTEEQLRQTAKQLQVEHNNLQLIFDVAHVGMVLVDEQLNMVRINNVITQLFGHDSEYLIGLQLGDGMCCIHALSTPQGCGHAEFCTDCPLRNTVQQVFETGQAVFNKEFEQTLRQNGQDAKIWLSLSASAIEMDGTKNLLISLQNITRHKQIEERLKNTLSEAERLNRILEKQTANANHLAAVAESANMAKSQFLANMSHEIRTPMNGVIGMTGLLLDSDLSDEQREFAEIIKSCGESLLALINDILDYSKIDAGKLELEDLDFDIRDVLEDFAGIMAIRAHQKNLEFICAADPDVPSYLKGDPGRLRQILTNLVGNAVKFTEAGEVVVHVRTETKTENHITLRFSIRDTGIGIPADKMDQLFGKFMQVDASTTRKYGGTGLGLAISKQLAELMGGHIGVNSEEGRGSEFWFTVRLGLRPESNKPPCPQTEMEGKRILIVDDNATNRQILTLRLKSWAVQTDAVPDGATALEMLAQACSQHRPYDAVITDMQMPEMDGLMLGQAIRRDRRFDSVHLIMMSSLGEPASRDEMDRLRFAVCLNKPIRPSELFTRLKAALTGHTVSVEPKPKTDLSTSFDHRSARILLAEDNTTNQQVALSILRRMGLHADAVADGAEAVKALEDIPYDLVLMDVQMPEMDGLEATRIIRHPDSAVRCHDIPIIAMTAHAMQGDRQRCIEAGMNDYISKPVTPRELAEILSQWLPKSDKPHSDKHAAAPHSDTAADTSTPIFDREGFLDRLMGDAEMAKTVIEVFLCDIPAQIESLKQSLQDADIETAERIAHTIKGAAASVGGEVLRELAAEIEQACKNNALDHVDDRVSELARRFDALKDIMENLKL